ncbi:VanZ family protein [Salinimicrobium sp. HB62]|uniref:VanZ family protein n=1 Tax=Salinimicrobium sp. HB62 TaxID=3077781 RepID=UPI002D765308|nr:VanZ family protein [Salinimicrobium sp. HB62]
MSKVKIIFLLPAILYTGLILYLSLINLADTPVKDLGMSDKMMHGGAYFGLGLLWMLFATFTFEDKGLFKRIVVISVISIAFGIFIEVLQDTLTSYRQLDFYDILANTIGVFVAGVFVWSLRKYLIRLKAKINLDLMKN